MRFLTLQIPRSYYHAVEQAGVDIAIDGAQVKHRRAHHVRGLGKEYGAARGRRKHRRAKMGDWTAVVLAAGRGSRMRSSRPKVLHTVAGLPLVAYAARGVRAVGDPPVIVVVSPASRSDVDAAVGEEAECVEQPDPLGTGHALATALIGVSPKAKHILVANGDVPLVKPETFQSARDASREAQGDGNAPQLLRRCSIRTGRRPPSTRRSRQADSDRRGRGRCGASDRRLSR